MMCLCVYYGSLVVALCATQSHALIATGTRDNPQLWIYTQNATEARDKPLLQNQEHTANISKHHRRQAASYLYSMRRTSLCKAGAACRWAIPSTK